MWGMSYIPLEEAAPMKPACESLGHFYEDFVCLYCPARYCATELGGHSFEGPHWENTLAGARTSPRYCYHCRRQVVNIGKG